MPLTKDYLYVGDGTTDAALMHVTANRSIGGTIIEVDTIVGVPDKFIGTSGTPLPSGFIDPSTATNFYGHLNGSDLEIDGFIPGSVDGGNTEGQIVVIKPNTAWANMIADFINEDQGFVAENLINNGNFHNNSANGYGGLPNNWANSSANPVQGGFPVFTKAWLIDLLGIADGDIEALYSLNGTFNDLSSNGYNLTPSGSPTDSDDGLIGQAKVFASASTQYATVSAPNAKLTGSQTFFAFVKPTTIGAQNPVLGFADSDATDFKFLSINTVGAITFRLDGLTTNTSLTGAIKLEANKWYFIAGVYDSVNTKLKVWVNGVKQEVTASGAASAGTSTNISVGRLGDYTTDKANSTIQAAGVLSVALTDAQIKLLFSQTLWRGIKVRRAASDGYVEYAFPKDMVIALRGKTITFRADVYQGTNESAQVEINDGSSEVSVVNTTINSWQTLSVTKEISASASSIAVRLKGITNNGTNWWKEAGVSVGDRLFPYQPSPEDWAEFPLLLSLTPSNIPNGYSFATKNMLGMVEEASTFSSSSTSPTQVTNMSLQFTVPEGGSYVELEFNASSFACSQLSFNVLSIWNGVVNSGTRVGNSSPYNSTATGSTGAHVKSCILLAAGHYTFNVGMNVTAGNGQIVADSTYKMRFTAKLA